MDFVDEVDAVDGVDGVDLKGIRLSQIWFGAAIVFALLVGGSALAQGPATITITKKGVDHRIPVAVPPFAAAPGQEAVARKMSEVVAYDLAFSGVCFVLPPERYPAGFTGFTQDAAQIDFAVWRGIGVQHLVYAHVTTDGSKVVAECRLFDVQTSQQVVGKRLQADLQWSRLVAHQYSDVIVERLSGVPGIATSRICFTSGATGNKEIFIADYDGANMKQLTQHGSISILPEFSPDGGKIAYVSFKDRFPFLYVLDVASGKSTAISKKSGLNVSPTWAPDGKSLAMVLSKDTNSEIYLKDLNGDNYQRITNEKGTDTSPTFSPDGGRIAFVTDRAGSEQIFVMNSDGSNQHRISFQGGRCYDPAWSPDGKLIAYVVEKGSQQIWVTTPNGSEQRQVSNAAGSVESPSWSADSRHIIYTNSRSGELWTVTLETGQEQRVPNITVRCQGPDWGPRHP